MVFGGYLGRLRDNPVKGFLLGLFGIVDYRMRAEYASISELLKPITGENILDAGSGKGYFSVEMAMSNKCNIIGTDLSVENAIQSTGLAKQLKLSNVSFASGNLNSLPFGDKSFDKIICLQVLEHVYNDKQLLAELFRVLKSGGELFVTTPHKQINSRRYFYLEKCSPEDHVREGYDLYGLRDMMENAGFKIATCRSQLKVFGEIAWELGRMFHGRYPRAWMLMFPLVWVLSRLDFVVSDKKIGNMIEIKAVKK